MNVLQKLRVGAVLAMSCAAVTAQPAQVTLTMEHDSVKVGDTFELRLVGQNFLGLDGGGVDLSFDPSKVRMNQVTVDPVWNFFSDPGSIDNVAGRLSGLSFNVWGPMSGDLRFATLSFSALEAGDFDIEVLANSMWPFGYGGDLVDVELRAFPLHISAVPEPTQALLLVLGALGLAGWRGLRSEQRERA